MPIKYKKYINILKNLILGNLNFDERISFNLMFLNMFKKIKLYIK